MIRIIIILVLIQPLITEADVVHRIRFCAGKFCATTAPLSISQQLEFNQQFAEGNLRANPSTQATHFREQTKQTASTSKLVSMQPSQAHR